MIEFISVCLCTPMANDTDCIRSRSTAANSITSGQNRDLEVCTKSEFATIMIFAFHFCFVIRCKYGLVFPNRLHPTISLNIALLGHLFRVRSIFYVTWACSYLRERFHMLSYWCPRCQQSPGPFFSISFIMVQFYILQRSCIYWTHCIV